MLIVTNKKVTPIVLQVLRKTENCIQRKAMHPL